MESYKITRIMLKFKERIWKGEMKKKFLDLYKYKSSQQYIGLHD